MPSFHKIKEKNKKLKEENKKLKQIIKGLSQKDDKTIVESIRKLSKERWVNFKYS